MFSLLYPGVAMQEYKSKASRSPTSEAWNCTLCEFVPSIKVDAWKIKIKQNTLWVTHIYKLIQLTRHHSGLDHLQAPLLLQDMMSGTVFSTHCLFTWNTRQPHKYSKLVFMYRHELCPQKNSRLSEGRDQVSGFLWVFVSDPLSIRCSS